MGEPLQFRVLGRVGVVDRAGTEIPLGGPKRQAVMARLLLDANRPVPFDRLIDDLWEGEPTPGAPATLQSHISRLRRLVGADRLRTVDGGYMLAVEPGELDAATAEAESATGRRLLADRKAREAAGVLETALNRWRGPLFGELGAAPWATAEATRLDDVRLQTLEALLAAYLTLGESAGVAARAKKEIARHPLRERLWALLIEGLYRDGRQADALRAYQRLRATLVEELGIEPSPELQALEQRVLAQDLDVAPEQKPAPAPAPALNSLPTGVVTFLLTDVVGSTRLWETAPDAMPAALGRHDGIIAEAVAANDGILLKARGEGDSTFSVFRRATDAVTAALAAQAALASAAWPPDCALTVRMAVHTGEALERDGDYYGRTVNRVARLRAITDPGQILVSRAVADVAIDHLPRHVTVVELGSRELRDLDRPEMVYAIEPWAPGTPETASDETPSLRRTHVTAVFAHFEEADDTGGRFDPELGRAVLGRYHVVLCDEVSPRGGHVVTVANDGVLAVFGVPDVREDDAERAVIAAEAMTIAAEKLGAELRAAGEVELAVAIGVDTGEVVVDGDNVFGDAVRVASRLAASGESGETLVGENAWRLTRHVASFDRLAPLELRGRAAPLAAYRLLATTTPVDSAAMVFVGRDTELATLLSLFDAAVDQRASRTATVIGSPGVGKTRLVSELCSAIEGRATVLRSGCDPARGATFAPVADLLGDIGDARVLEELLARDSERERVMATVEGLLGGGSPGTPEETFWAIRRLIETAAERHPVLLVLDDLHWAEPLLLDLVEHLGEWITDRAVLLLAVARPELRELRPALAEPARRTSTVIALEGLDAGATERLACELLGTAQAPPELLARLVPSTEGNPLFVRELVRMLVDDGVLRPEDDGWQLTIDAATIDVPPTIQALLAARVDRLSADERTVLERAAVIGTELYRGLLAELVPAEVRPRLDAVLEGLRRKELLEPAGSYWIDERVLRFHHVLIRDASYRRLLRENRSELHERCARWIADKTGGGVEHDELIGYHLEQAQANLRALGPLDQNGRDVANEAAVRLASAARRALDRDDLAAAGVLAGRGLGCLDPDDPRRAELLIVRCEVLLGEGNVGTAADALQELARQAFGDERLHAWATCFEVQRSVLVDPRRIGDSEERVTAAAARLAALGDPAGAAKAHRVHAAVLARLGRVGDCEVALDRALSAARKADDRRQITGVLGVAPLAALWGPSPVPRAGGRCLDVIRLVRITTGAAAVEATSIRCQAMLEALRGRFDAARSMLATARAAAEDLGLRHGVLEVELFAGIIELWADDPAAAEDHLRVAHDGFRSMGVDADAAQAAAFRARAAFAMGQHDDALAYAATSEELGGQDLKTAIAWRAVRAEVLADRGAIDEATELAEAAVALAERTDALVDHGDACAALAAVKRAAGDATGAATAAARAQALYEQKGASALAVKIDQSVTPAGGSASAPLSSARPENTASRTMVRLLALQAAGRMDELAALLAPGIIDDDRRPGMGAYLEGVGAVSEMLTVVGRLGAIRIDCEAIAVRGDRLALVRSAWRGEAFEVPLLTVVRVDEVDRPDLTMTFDVDDLAGALVVLDELYAEGEGSDYAACIRTNSAAIAATNRGDWDSIRSLFEEGATFDHRLASKRVLAVNDRCMLAETEFLDSVDGSGPYHTPVLTLTRLRTVGGRIEHTEVFEPDQLALAWARYHELSGDDVLENDAVRVFQQLADFVHAGRIEDAAAIMAPDYVDEDRRFGLRNRNERDTVLAQYRIASQLGARTLGSTVLAVRGERLALEHQLVGTDQFEAEILLVFGTDSSGLASFAVLFDPAAMVDALAELEERFALDEGLAYAACLRVNAAAVTAHNRREWDRFRAQWADDIAFVDHRAAGYGELRGLDRFMELSQTSVDVAPDFIHVLRRFLAVDDRCSLAESVPIVSGAEASTYDRPRLILTKLRTANGPIERYESFEPEQLELAWSRYRELATPAPSVLQNTATRVWRTGADLAFAGRFEELRDQFAPQYRLIDRRPGLSASIEGPEAAVENMRAAIKLGVRRVESETLAIRGDRLALIRGRYSGDTFEADIVVVEEVNSEGESSVAVLFDADDLAGALVELDQRYAAGEGAGLASVRRLADASAASNRRDWDCLGAQYADDAVVVDHRLASFGETRGPGEIIDRQRVAVDLIPDFLTFAQRLLAVDETTVLSELGHRATPATGGSYEMTPFLVSKLRGSDGPIERLEFFGAEQLDLAWSRYRQLSTSADNAALRTAR